MTIHGTDSFTNIIDSKNYAYKWFLITKTEGIFWKIIQHTKYKIIVYNSVITNHQILTGK